MEHMRGLPYLKPAVDDALCGVVFHTNPLKDQTDVIRDQTVPTTEQT